MNVNSIRYKEISFMINRIFCNKGQHIDKHIKYIKIKMRFYHYFSIIYHFIVQ